MYEKLKKQPLIGLALAITCGYVLAHIVIKTGDALYENDPDFLVTLAFAALATSAIVWKRRGLLAWLRSLRREPGAPVARAPRSAAFRAISYSFGILLLSLGALASLAVRDASPFVGIGMALGAFVLTYRFIVKVARWRSNEPWRKNYSLAIKEQLLRDAAECMAEADAAAAAEEAARVAALRARNEAQRLRMRELLRADYRHKPLDGRFDCPCKCSMCGKRDTPLAIHVIEKSYGSANEIVRGEGAVYYGSAAGYVRAFFPLCAKCAPPCRKCQLPTVPVSVVKFAISINAKLGCGTCSEHVHWRQTAGGLIAKLTGQI